MTNRRKEDAADSTKPAILKAIADCKDDNMRAVLLLMLAVLEEIGSKIDAAMSDERTLREMVLNGHSGVHDGDHEWIAECREKRVEEVCVWAREKMRKEADAHASKRKISEEIIGKAVVAALAVLGTLLLTGVVKTLGM
jgi:hypothetical protein